MKENIIQKKSFEFALRSIDLYKYMIHEQKEYVLSKQYLRSATSIGANVEESIAAVSRKDFANKLGVSSKESRESLFWLKLIKYYGVDEFPIDSLMEENEEIIKIISKILKTVKSNDND